MMDTFVIVLLALIFDRMLGEAKRFHPLVGFGNIANRIEQGLNNGAHKKLKGLIAVFIAIAPITFVFVLIDSLLQDVSVLYMLFSAFVLYLAIGWQSLIQHALNISQPLQQKNLAQARKAVSLIVSRDTEHLSETDIAKAATESVLENGSDAIFSAIFWFCVLGVPGVVIYRLSNTLDAMWGYKNERFIAFGWAAARFDDLLNLIPARLTALSYSFVGNTRLALKCWRQQGFSWKSPNAGPVMAAGAGALNVSLGGAAQYHNELQIRQALGPDVDMGGEIPVAESINKACELLNRALLLWLLVIAIVSVGLGLLL
ncbi:adenosylcobinamide-phosphate synthase CbiB [Alkalimarinus alittae]|uniref:Cobalamin biosynthesis protein CobD n=1 Tax=Alkalimarinus alittae TaxID=2961619 RepID=A0ABY6N662_9ALTE|nr:adenosylcobinamide-phosphate synthase CbiB [Alkalimarinus alittae]UZE97494.1 adenosylcobinamide-phosphate synthase CbiB [Alkalimarinus alittae]